MNKTTHKSNPIPTRFEEPEYDFIREVARETGLPRSEVIRRGVAALRCESRKHSDFGFLLAIAS